MNKLANCNESYLIWRRAPIVVFVIAILIFGSVGCSQLSAEEIAKLVDAEVSRQIAQFNLESKVEPEVKRQIALLDVVQGPPGPGGLQGSQGSPGPKGDPGMQGPRGIEGPAGGVSEIYDLYDGHRVDDLESKIVSLEDRVQDLETRMYRCSPWLSLFGPCGVIEEL